MLLEIVIRNNFPVLDRNIACNISMTHSLSPSLSTLPYIATYISLYLMRRVLPSAPLLPPPALPPLPSFPSFLSTYTFLFLLSLLAQSNILLNFAWKLRKPNHFKYSLPLHRVLITHNL